MKSTYTFKRNPHPFRRLRRPATIAYTPCQYLPPSSFADGLRPIDTP